MMASEPLFLEGCVYFAWCVPGFCGVGSRIHTKQQKSQMAETTKPYFSYLSTTLRTFFALFCKVLEEKIECSKLQLLRSAIQFCIFFSNIEIFFY